MAIYRGSGGSVVADTLSIDGDYGDITVANSGQDWTINAEAVTLDKIQSISTATLLGRASVGTGIVEEIPLTQVGRDLLDDVTVADQRTTLGLGTAATTASSDYATAAQGALAGTAIQPADITDVVRDSDIVNMLETTDIGVTVQGYDLDTAKYDDVTANFTGTLQNGGSNVVVDTDIGSTVLAYDSNLQSFVNTFTLPTVDGTNGFVLTTNGSGTLQFSAGGGGLADGDKGDITVSGGGTVWNIDAGVITTTELGGDITTAGKALLDDADASAQRTTLGLGNLALQGDGDKGDITVSATGTTWTIDSAVVTTSKIADSNVTLAKLEDAAKTEKIQPITASVSSNALTITLNPTVLDFRSSTLGSGTVNTRTVSSAISVVVSSGSTLGTINAVTSRLAVLAIDNAGTVELAVVNVSGGNNLDETDLISTTAEGGAGAADSASVIYSTTARTNVPYRVVGFIASTQATAGTWATAPSKIQGYGGNAFATMGSIGYGQVWTDVKASRSLSTTYYNTSGKPIQVHVSLSSTAGTTLTATIGGVSFQGMTQGTTGGQAVISFIVPINQSYSVINGSGTPSLSFWGELR
jgi:hypothetical protein